MSEPMTTLESGWETVVPGHTRRCNVTGMANKLAKIRLPKECGHILTHRRNRNVRGTSSDRCAVALTSPTGKWHQFF